MVALDTDHLSALERPGAATTRLVERLGKVNREVMTTAVCVRERIDGWLAEIRRLERLPHEQITAYGEFVRLIEVYSRWGVLPWDREAADLFVRFRSAGVRIGTNDLKIACIAIAHDATLLTRNTTDFHQVPGLRFESWLD